MENEHQPIMGETQQSPAMGPNEADPTARFVFTWRTAGLTTGARTINDMIVALEGATDALRLLKKAGVILDAGAGAGNDALLVTTDPVVAQRFGFQQEAAKEQDAEKRTEDQSQEDTGPK